MTGLEIGVIGMAGRFPGAKNIHEFWNNLKNGIESISFFSDEELEKAGIDPGLIKKNAYVKANGILEDNEYFDNFFFGYTNAEADIMDPQIRIFHECAWTALEDAAYDPDIYSGLIGLYAGAAANFTWEALAMLSGKTDILGSFNAAQLIRKDYLCHRVSYKMNLKGPVFSIYTTCSTSLVAIHLACQGLLSGECDIALAGGVTITFPQKTGFLYQEGMTMSPDGHCRAFDARARGTIGGNGAGVVALKRLNDALEDRDHLYAVIKGSAINNDGSRKTGFTAPSISGQARVIRTAQQMAEVEPDTITYVEAHGTGTTLGDPIEIKALNHAFNTGKRAFCALGSVKTNFGHLDTAAGAAGFIKTALALKNRLIPPSLNFESPNPEIDFENSPFYVNTELKEWKNDKYPLRAAVSSFGMGGTNAHVILEEAPECTGGEALLPDDEVPCQARGEVSSPITSREYQLILLSARTETALELRARNLVDHFQKNPGINLTDTTYTLQVGRKAFEHRRMVICSTIEETVHALSTHDNNDSASHETGKMRTFFSKENDRPVIFMFPGQGAQYVNMGLDLYKKEPTFRNEMDRCFEILKRLVEYDIKEILYPATGNHRSNRSYTSNKSNESDLSDINQTEISQPVIFIIEYALAKLLMKWGIQPWAMIGHSIGEYTAATLSGVMSLEDALTLVVLRGKQMQSIPGGAMRSVTLPQDQLQPFLNEEISLAAVNTPSSCVFSGPPGAVEALAKQLEKEGYESKPLHTSRAFHSQMMNPILKSFEEQVWQIPLNEPSIPYISNVSGTWTTDQQASDPLYWARHLRETVQFSRGVKTLLEQDDSLFLEVGPGRTLTAFVKQHMNNNNRQLAVNLIRHPREPEADDYYLTDKIGYLWLTGVEIDWQEFHQGEKRYRISLPTYPFEKKRFWPEKTLAQISKFSHPDTSRLNEIEKGEIPGEIQEVETPLPSRETGTQYIPTGNQIEESLAGIWRKLFGLEEVGISADFFELGGDSLLAMNAVSHIHKVLDVKIPLDFFFANPTIEKLARYINQQTREEKYSHIQPVEKKAYYPISPVQHRLLFLHYLDPGNLYYNLPLVRIMEGNLEQDTVMEIFRKLVKRHENFRTSFHIIAGQPLQEIHEESDIEYGFEYFEQEEHQVDQQVKKFVRPFRLDQAPLLRVCLIKIIESVNPKFVIMVDMHHIISDGTSMVVFLKELSALATGEELPPLIIQYKDYAGWYNKEINSGSIKKQEEFWLKQFETGLPLFSLPADYPRPPVKSQAGDAVSFEIGEEVTGKLKDLAFKENATLYMTVLAIYYVFLSKLSGREDIVVATAVHGRNHTDLEQIIGMFVNTLFFRNYPGKDKIFIDFLREVKTRTLEAFENQDFQTDTLVDKQAGNRNPAYHPITEVGFIIQTFKVPPIEFTGVKLSTYKLEFDTTIFDFNCIGRETGENLSFIFQYCTKLFKRETIERFVKYFKEILAQVVENKSISLKTIEISVDLLTANEIIPEIDFEL